MARKPKAFDIWREMKPAALWRLALAVFLMFAVLAPLTVLMESRVEPRSWVFLLVQTIASGGMAASIVLLGRKRWWTVLLVVAFWSAVLIYNSGGLSIQVNDEGMRVFLQGTQDTLRVHPPATPVTLSPAKLNELYEWRGFVGMVAIGLLVIGYVMFIKVIRSEVRQRAQFETEIALAREIQESLQPVGKLETSKFSAFGMTIPASEVGGDYFDLIQKDEDTLIAAIADVTGHGVGAGILSAMTKSALYMELAHTTDPGIVLRALNNTIHSLSDEKTFVTFALVEFRLREGRIRAVTAGHPPILVKRAGSGMVEEIRTRGLALGMRPVVDFQVAELAYAPGDRLCLYTDGIVEAANAKNEEFGTDRLRDVFVSATDGPEEFCKEATRQVREFANNGTPQDDVSLLAIDLR